MCAQTIRGMGLEPREYSRSATYGGQLRDMRTLWSSEAGLCRNWGFGAPVSACGSDGANCSRRARPSPLCAGVDVPYAGSETVKVAAAIVTGLFGDAPRIWAIPCMRSIPDDRFHPRGGAYGQHHENPGPSGSMMQPQYRIPAPLFFHSRRGFGRCAG